MKNLIDRIQMWLYLAGFFRIASFIGRFGSSPQFTSANEDDRITLPMPDPFEDIDIEYVDDADVENRSGPGWCLDEMEVGPLRVIDFDPTFHKNQQIDMERDLAFPTTKFDIN